MGGTWPRGNCFPSQAEMLTSPQALFLHMPTGSPIPSPHPICSYREALCSKGFT